MPAKFFTPTEDSKKIAGYAKWLRCSNAVKPRSPRLGPSRIKSQLSAVPLAVFDGIGERFPRLTQRHVEMVMGIALDMCRKQIAQDLDVTLKTVEFHIRNARKITKTNTDIGLLWWALDVGLIRH